jgi:hypothetical protein
MSDAVALRSDVVLPQRRRPKRHQALLPPALDELDVVVVVLPELVILLPLVLTT